jgi:hypothetical protein
VLKDEIAAASQVALHLLIPHDPALKLLAERLASGSEYRNNLALLAHESGVPSFRYSGTFSWKPE